MGTPLEPAPPPPAIPAGCPVCGDPLVRDDLVICLDCDAPHHEGCWVFNKGCATYACAGKVYVVPPADPAAAVAGLSEGFRRKTSPQALMALHLGIVPLSFAAGLLLALFGPAVGGAVMAASMALWAACFFTAFFGGHTVHTALDGPAEVLRLETRVLGIKVGTREIPRDRVRALVTRSYVPWFMKAQAHLQGYGVPTWVQLFAALESGEEVMIDSQQNEQVYELLWKAERLAGAAETTVRLEPEFFTLARPRPELIEGIRALPSGGGVHPQLPRPGTKAEADTGG